MAHRCSLVRISAPRPRAARRPGRCPVRRYSPTASQPSSPAAANSLSPFTMWPAFPASDYYEDSAPPRCHQPTTDLPTTDLAGQWAGRLRGGSHVPADRSTGAVPSSSPAAWPRVRRRPSSWPSGRDNRAGTEPLGPGSTGSRLRCCPAHIHQVGAGVSSLRGFHHWFTSSCTFPSRLPNPDLWRCRPVTALSRLLSTPCVSRVRLPPASAACCDRPQVGPFLPPGHAAPRGARWRPRTRRGTQRGRGGGP